jgi:ubiquinone/menaquinone biosynthesis C-methylase UbiE
VWGLDDDSSSLTDHVLPRAKERCASARLVKADAASSPFPDAYFDIVFLIDTLPYIVSEKKLQVLQECLRMIRQTGEMVISLPIELGPVLLLREFARYWSKSWRDGYSWGILFRAACFTHSPERNFVAPKNLLGYDYRNDIALLRSMMRIEAIRYSPFRFAHGLNPFVLLRCFK